MIGSARISLAGLAFLIAAFSGFGYIAYRDTNALEINTYAIRHPELSRSIAGVKIAFLTDLHIRKYGPREDRILAVLDAEKPDLLLLAGDYIHFQGSFAPAQQFLNRLRASLGVFAVLGNTDYTNQNGSCILCHERNSENRLHDAKPIFLRNDCITLAGEGKKVNLIGIDDPVTKRRKHRANHDISESMHKINNALPGILLTHSPEVYPDAAGHFSLILAGHNHGGQVNFLSPLRQLFSPEPSYNYMKGFYEKNGTLLFVSRGIGRSSLPFRFGSKPEITFLQIEAISSDNRDNAIRWFEKSSRTEYAGFDTLLLIESFNPLPYIGKKIRVNRWRKDRVLFDFENQTELQRLNLECGTSLKRVREHATSGAYSLRVKTPADKLRDIEFSDFRSDWAGSDFLKMDIFNPRTEEVLLCMRIDDSWSRDNPRDHLDRSITLKKGMNRISIELQSLRTNRFKRQLDLHSIEHMVFYTENKSEPLEFYLDHLRLE